MRRYRLWLPLCAFALGACGEDARISVSAALDAPFTLDMLTVTVVDVTRVVQFTGADFRTDANHPTPTTPEVETRTSGPDLQVSYIINNADQVVSVGEVTLPRRSDWRWHVSIAAATTDPQEGCFGCFGSKAFALAQSFRAPQRDSIWLVWSGNSISDPAIY
jgi:hypothetical protein